LIYSNFLDIEPQNHTGRLAAVIRQVESTSDSNQGALVVKSLLLPMIDDDNGIAWLSNVDNQVDDTLRQLNALSETDLAKRTILQMDRLWFVLILSTFATAGTSVRSATML